MEISIGMLSWKSEKTLKNTLKSYKRNGLLELTDDFTILFQEVSDDDKKIAEKFGVRYIGLNDNIGIGKAIEKLARNAKYDHFLFLEHDWELVENQNTTKNQLEKGLQFLQNGFDVVKYRSRSKPGIPLYSADHKGKELEYFDDWHQVTSPHLLESLHWLDPAEQFPDKIQKQEEFFISTSRWANWSNNPFLIHKNFYLEKLLPFAGSAVQFERNIAPWWVKQNFKIAQGEGLFKHNDLKKFPKKTVLWKFKNILNRQFNGKN